MLSCRTANPAAPALIALSVVLILSACAPRQRDADVIVIGAGIAGLSAALEASAAGKKVLVVDANSVGGGHAVKAGGFALVGTPLQEQKGYRDSPDVAFKDLMSWGEDADAGWVRRYVDGSRTEVYDWLEQFGVRFTFILDTPEHSVPRFHFAGGSAVNVVTPMLRAALARDNVRFLWNTEAIALTQYSGRVTGVKLRNLRTGVESGLQADAVVIATGGFQSNLERVRQSWRPGLPAPEKLYAGAGQFATGSGLGLGERAGASLARMDHQVTFTTGFPDPRNPGRALLSQNPAAIWVNSAGERFINERASSKLADAAVLRLEPATHWLIFDEPGSRDLRIRDAVWLKNPDAAATLATAPNVKRADSIRALAAAAGLPAEALERTVARYNAGLKAGEDPEFGRFTAKNPDESARGIAESPFYAVQLFPLTRKSMGGLAVDDRTRVLDRQGNPIAGLYAVGEVTGVAGINGSFGGEGTFLGPAVFTGRIAGLEAGWEAGRADRPAIAKPLPTAPRQIRPSADPAYRARSVTVKPEVLDALAAADRPGYWHFTQAHRIVRQRGLNCLNCHTPEWPTKPAESPAERQVQLLSCVACH